MKTPRLFVGLLALTATTVSLYAQDPNRVVRINNDEAMMHRGGRIWIPVLNNDYDGTGKMNRKSVTVVEAPRYGTATAGQDGNILYIHTEGEPAEDFFTYQVNAISGGSGTARVKVRFSSDMRLANATLNVPAIPPGTAYQLVDALPGVPFEGPTGLDSPPGDLKRLFVLEKTGLMKLVPDVSAV